MAKTNRKTKSTAKSAARSEAPAKALLERKSGRKALGRGLSALMAPRPVPVQIADEPSVEDSVQQESVQEAPEVQQEAATVVKHPRLEEAIVRAEDESMPPSPQSGGALLSVEVNQVSPNPKQPRQAFREEDIDSLSKSIRETGLLQPIIVRQAASAYAMDAAYEIVAGERRWRAARKAGLHSIPVLVRTLSDQEVLEIGIIENVQRADLNPIEEAQAYQRLSSEFGQTQVQIAEVVGKDRASIANALRLLRLAPEVQKQLAQGKISAGHGRALLMLGNDAEQRALANKIIKGGLSVRDAEKFASRKAKPREAAGSKAPKSVKQSYQVMEVEDRLRRALGTKVQLQMNASGGGDLTIKFYSPGELESLLERLNA